MTQDQTFLAPTLNATLAVPALPQASLDGHADLLNANLELNSAVTNRLRLKAEYTHNDRDNRTPQAAYDWVTTDMFVGPPRTRTNLPYGFTQDRFKLRADYRASASIRTSVGFDHDSNERTFQEVDTTRENTIWGKVASRFPCNVDVTLMLAHGDRSNSGYEAVAAVIPSENPLLRRYNMADRTRDSAELRADIAATQRVSIGLQADASDDEYSDSTIGLTSGNEFNFGGDITLMISEQTDLRFFANRQVIKSEQAGSQAYSTSDWRGDNEDTIDLAGIGVKHLAIKDRLEVGADYTATRSRSEISVKAPAGDSEFPDFSTSLDSLKLYASYRMKEYMSLRAAYWYEDYDSKNWMLDGVAPDTIRNVLTFGELSPRYRVHVIAVSVNYEF